VVEYLSVETGSNENTDKKVRKVFEKPWHPHVRKSYELLEPYFEELVRFAQFWCRTRSVNLSISICGFVGIL
jgi:hypothetical protein